MSSADLAARLPEPTDLRSRSIALATLDILLGEAAQYRYFDFAPAWRDGTALASMTNGSGDEYSIVFAAEGVFVRGFDHESDASPYMRHPPELPPGLIDGLPPELEPYASEPSLAIEGGVLRASIVAWRTHSDDVWRHGAGGDGAWLFDEVVGGPAAYQQYASEYYEVDVPEEAAARIFAHEPLTKELLAVLAPGRVWDAVEAEICRVGYPAA